MVTSAALWRPNRYGNIVATMRLLSVDVRGYKRFASRTYLDVDNPLIAIVGPNEAGKTSLLDAMVHLSARKAFARNEFSGRQPPADTQAVVRARYAVESVDREAIGDLLDPNENYELIAGSALTTNRLSGLSILECPGT